MTGYRQVWCNCLVFRSKFVCCLYKNIIEFLKKFFICLGLVASGLVTNKVKGPPCIQNPLHLRKESEQMFDQVNNHYPVLLWVRSHVQLYRAWMKTRPGCLSWIGCLGKQSNTKKSTVMDLHPIQLSLRAITFNVDLWLAKFNCSHDFPFQLSLKSERSPLQCYCN